MVISNVKDSVETDRDKGLSVRVWVCLFLEEREEKLFVLT